MNRAFRLPRPLLLDSAIRTSVVQLLRGVELASSQKILEGSTLEMESLDVRDSQLLQELLSPVGRLELGDRLRETPELPLEVTLTGPRPRGTGAPSCGLHAMIKVGAGN